VRKRVGCEKMNAFRRVNCGLAVLLALASPAAAADLLAPEQVEVATESGWTFAFAPYLWAAGLEGDIAQFGLPAIEVDASFLDILENFDFGIMGVGEARYGRLGFVSDLMYIKLSADSDVNAGPIDANIELTSEMFTFLGAVEFRLLESEGGSLDALAGARVWWLKTEIDFSGQIFNASGSDSETWVDPIVGLKGRLNFSPDFYFTSWAMIGGFGVSSDFTWDVMGGLGYNAWDSVSLVAGYRGLGVDYENDGFVFDVVQHGPIIGAVFRF
jgi:opacity protein-like surface antigen